MTIHAKRGPVWGVRLFAMCAIGQLMASRVAIFCSVLLPLLGFGYTQDEIRDKVTGCYRYYYSDDYTVKSSYFIGKLSAVENHLKLNDIAIQTTRSYVAYPDFSDVSYSSTNLYSSETALRCIEVNSTKYAPLNTFPSLYVIYNFATSLYASGYRGTGFKLFQEIPPSSVRFNFNYSLAVADCASSTNTVFRQILFQHLSSINSSLSSIGSSVGTINADYQTVNNLYLDPSKQNLLDSAANPSSLNANSSISANLDRLFGSSYAGRESEITKALSDLARSQLQAAWLSTLDPDSPFYMQNLDNIISDPDTFQKAALQGGGGGGSALANIMRDVKKLSTNDWVSGVTNQLANNRASITNQLAHMFDDDTSVGSKLGNIQTSSALTASSAGSIDQRLANGITVAVVNSGANSVLVSLDGPINIDQNQFNSLSVPIGSLQNTVSDWYSDWYDVFRSGSQYRWGEFVDYFLAYKTQNHLDLLALSSISNSLSSIQDLLRTSLPDLTNNVSTDFSALLLDDYDDYITNGHYSDFLFDLQSQYPDVFEDLDQLGLSSQTGSGNWWTLAGSSLGYLSAQVHSNVVMFSSVFGDIQRVKQFADDNGNFNGDFYSAASDVIASIPSKTQVANYIEQCTNAANSVSALELVSFYSTASNEVNKVFRLFNRGSNLPSEVVIMHHGLNGEHTFSIPVGDQPRLWLLIRLGIMFVTCAVNLILLPKFILKIFILFMTMFKKSIPYLNSDYN